jgi:UDP-N-acetylglucosamine 2-epimerase
MMLCRAVVGNSSSGLIEAPAVPVPTVNIGDRQRGRPRATSVVDCSEDPQAIAHALRTALSAEFRAGLSETVSPYGTGGSSERIAEVLCHIPLAGLHDKPFQDEPLAST